MIRLVLGLAFVVALLALADVGLRRGTARARSSQSRAGALFAPEEAAHLRKQPMVTLAWSGESHRFGRIDGHWVCLSSFNAPADERALSALLDGLAGAEGIVVAQGAEAAPRYGINTSSTITVRIHGPRALQHPLGDVQAEFDLGTSVAGRDECYLRQRGKAEVWLVGSDLRALVERRAPDLPPLAAPSAIPGPWLAEAQGLARVEVHRRGSPTWSLVRQELAFDAARSSGAKRPWSWRVLVEGREEPCDEDRAEAYTRLVEALPYVAILEPSPSATEAGEPTSSVTLVGRSGARLDLELHAPLADGRVPMTPRLSAAPGRDGPRFVLEAEVAALLSPDPRRFADDGSPNPWEAALGAGQPRVR